MICLPVRKTDSLILGATPNRFLPNMLAVTLLSDLGTQDTAICAAKAVLSRQLPEAGIVDITHQIGSFNLQEAAYTLLKAYRHFPEGSVHLVMADVLRGDRNRMLLAAVNGHYFIAPDNGILGFAFRGIPVEAWLCKEFNTAVTILQWVNEAANVISILRQGHPFKEHFMPFSVSAPPSAMPQLSARKRADCHILHIDRYGNIVLNITRAEFNELADSDKFSISFPGENTITAIRQCYSEVTEGELLCRFNSLNYMEIAANRASAASRFRLDKALPQDINYRIITINF